MLSDLFCSLTLCYYIPFLNFIDLIFYFKDWHSLHIQFSNTYYMPISLLFFQGGNIFNWFILTRVKKIIYLFKWLQQIFSRVTIIFISQFSAYTFIICKFLYFLPLLIRYKISRDYPIYNPDFLSLDAQNFICRTSYIYRYHSPIGSLPSHLRFYCLPILLCHIISVVSISTTSF